MEYDNFRESILEEIEDIIDVSKERSICQQVPIIFDGRQYTVKIPKKVAEKALISENDRFEFCVSTKLKDNFPMAMLSGKVVKKDEH